MFEQPLQEQLAPQNLLLAKHSQYNLRHLDRLQLHDLISGSFTIWSFDKRGGLASEADDSLDVGC